MALSRTSLFPRGCRPCGAWNWRILFCGRRPGLRRLAFSSGLYVWSTVREDTGISWTVDENFAVEFCARKFVRATPCVALSVCMKEDYVIRRLSLAGILVAAVLTFGALRLSSVHGCCSGRCPLPRRKGCRALRISIRTRRRDRNPRRSSWRSSATISARRARRCSSRPTVWWWTTM